jgi:hypothetical protein
VKVLWKRKACGCVNSYLASAGPVSIRCARHRGKRAKKGRALCYFDSEGIVRREHE